MESFQKREREREEKIGRKCNEPSVTDSPDCCLQRTSVVSHHDCSGSYSHLASSESFGQPLNTAALTSPNTVLIGGGARRKKKTREKQLEIRQGGGEG